IDKGAVYQLIKQNPERRRFIQKYFEKYPDWPLVRMKKPSPSDKPAQAVVAYDRNQDRVTAYVVSTDRALCVLRFPPRSCSISGANCFDYPCEIRGHLHLDETIFRGSSRIHAVARKSSVPVRVEGDLRDALSYEMDPATLAIRLKKEALFDIVPCNQPLPHVVWQYHTECTPVCLAGLDRDPADPLFYKCSPLHIPLLCGWRRMEVGSELTIDLFCFDPAIETKNFVHVPDTFIRSPDFAGGMENMPIPVVNTVDDDDPPKIYKTAQSGWGVRALCDIPAGAFIANYVGALLTDSLADALQGEDEYFADLDLNDAVENEKATTLEKCGYLDMGLGSSDDEINEPAKPRNEVLDDGIGSDSSYSSTEEEEPKTKRRRNRKERLDENRRRKKLNAAELERIDAAAAIGDDTMFKWSDYFGENNTLFVVDAKKKGNVGRFLNHSCDPNVQVQHVFVDTHDLRLPWSSFFAIRNIRAGEVGSFFVRYMDANMST
uniref:SET domain-containing protein n=1 Tax=Angiostrongylus cantonensis TaxID=6313 RepID=A0A158P7E2_ANGCA